ncbi:major facilitator superfamily domain-containing protein [Fusarium sp. MPI-SDFR-AT-0072]|nr:major facilitator superfamily domain-containing protein [Fusarium sp. MPI-SDFR-AT-0072]
MAKPVVDHFEQHDENNSVDLGYSEDNVETFDHPKWKSGFVDIAEDFRISVQHASYLTSLFIVVLGAAPLFWRPLGQTYGRRPIFLISLIGSLVGNIGCAKSPSYGAMGLCRAIAAWFISPAASLGSAVVAESFEKKDRARYMGVWTTMVTLGVPLAPFVFGFVTVRVGYRWTYWILAIINAVQFVLFFFLGLETRYVPGQATVKKSGYFTFHRIDPTPIKIVDFIAPLGLITRRNVVIAAVSYSTAFLWGSVTTTFEIPQIFPETYGFNNQQVGLQYIGIILGTLIGEFAGGFFSDQWMWRRQRRGRKPEPEYRLWLSYFGYLLVISGVVVFFVQIAKSGTKWNITPIIGAAVAAVGNQIITTIMITYAVDCYPSESAAIGVFITFIRQTLGFIGPFWIPEMLQNTGYYASCGIITASLVTVSIIPTMLLQARGHKWRE